MGNTYDLSQAVTHTNSVWEMLANTTLPICMYGMGDGAEKIMNVMEQYNIQVSEFFASDQFVRGHYFKGFRVKSISEIDATYDEYITVVSFASQRPEVLDFIKDMGEKHLLVIPDTPVVGTNQFTYDYYKENYDKLNAVYNLLADQKSRDVFVSTIHYKITGDPKFLWEMESHKDEAFTDILKISTATPETYLDLGAYRGDTIDELLHYTNGEYNHIIGVEPDSKTFKKLQSHCEDMKNVTLHNVATWNKSEILLFDKRSGRNSKLANTGKVEIPAMPIDSIVSNLVPTYIKMDIEGAEKEGLEGGANTLAAHTPKLNIAGYHRSEDLFEIPLQIHNINPNYNIYLRHHPYFPAWDNNFYCIKKS